MSRRVSSRTIIGREAELAALDRLLGDTNDGLPGMAVITGEAGVGKSRLATALEARARALGFIVLHGESIEFGGEGFAYAPVRPRCATCRPIGPRRPLQSAAPEVREALAALLRMSARRIRGSWQPAPHTAGAASSSRICSGGWRRSRHRS